MSYIATAVAGAPAPRRRRSATGTAPPTRRARAAPLAGSSSTSAGVGLVPVRPLPAVGLQEHRAELALPRVERADAQVARQSRRLQRVQDVVDLDEVLRRGLADVVRGELHVLEAVHVAAVQVERGCARRRAARATARATPAECVTQTASAIQKPATSGDSPISGHAVGGEGEDAVEAVVDLAPRAAQGSSAWRLLPGRREVLRGEGEHRRHASASIAPRSSLGVDRHRPVGVGADAEAVDVLAEVEVLVLVAQDRQAGLGRSSLRPASVGHRPGPWRLVGQRQQRHGHADHRRRSPGPRSRRSETTMSAGSVAVGRSRRR